MVKEMNALFVKGDVYTDTEGGVWTVDYEGRSCCGNDVVTFQGHINGKPYGMTLDRPDAYAKRESGALRKMGQLDLLFGSCAI